MKNSRSFIASLFAVLLLSSCEPELSIHEPGNLVPRTVDQDSSLPSIKVNGAQLHSEAFGNPNDPMIVVLHGGPGIDYRHLLNCKEFATMVIVSSFMTNEALACRSGSPIHLIPCRWHMMT